MNYLKSFSFKTLLLFTLLITTYFIYAFYNLGSKNIPFKYEVFNHKHEISIFQFAKAKKIDKLCYYTGINKNSKLSFEQKQQERWKEFLSTSKNVASFQWICHDVNVTAQKIRFKLLEGQVMINELRVSYKGSDINFTTPKKRLNDEPHIKETKSYYNNMVFDEIYHARTAYEIMRDIYPVYENTHPYLGKLIIMQGIKLFGMNPFGWRFSSVIFGALFILMAYFFALKLFNRRLYALVGAFLLTYSFMHLTWSRLGLIDTFGALFVFVSYYFLYIFIKKQRLSWLLLSGIFFGLASAVKWSAVFASLGFLAIALYLIVTRYPLAKQFKGYRLILYGLLSYGLLAIFVYTLTFYDIYLKTGSLQSIWDYQVNMLAYHSKLVSTHPYSSAWWSWALDIKPMCAYRNIEGTQFSSITMFGNPAIFWVGIVAMLYLVYVFIKRRTLEGTFILFAYLALYLPYAFVGRVMFIYHYYYALPFLILAIVYGVRDFLSFYPKQSILLWIYLAIVAGLFLAFYPVLSGYTVPKSYVDNVLIWLPSWWL